MPIPFFPLVLALDPIRSERLPVQPRYLLLDRVRAVELALYRCRPFALAESAVNGERDAERDTVTGRAELFGSRGRLVGRKKLDRFRGVRQRFPETDLGTDRLTVRDSENVDLGHADLSSVRMATGSENRPP